jgi:hypothetical protein
MSKAYLLVICLLASSFTGCLDSDELEQMTTEDETDEDDNTENTNNDVDIIGCMDESALNYDGNATIASDLCLTEEELLLAEEVFWSSWDGDVVNNATEPIGYLMLVDETSSDGENTRELNVQEVFSSDFYDQTIEVELIGSTVSDNGTEGDDNGTAKSSGGHTQTIYYFSRQTVFDNRVQVEKKDDEGEEKYSMNVATTYNDFRNSLEHGPGIGGENHEIRDPGQASSSQSRGDGDGKLDSAERKEIRERLGFPSLTGVEQQSAIMDKLVCGDSLRGTFTVVICNVKYSGTDTNTVLLSDYGRIDGVEIEVMGEMTMDGFRITEYCNEIVNAESSIVENYIEYGLMEKSSGITWDTASRIILLDSQEMRFEEYDYEVPVIDLTLSQKALPYHFIVDEDTGKSSEGKKGMNAVNVKVVIAGPSGPYGSEGDLSDYRLIVSDCTFDNATTGADEEATSARSSGNNEFEIFGQRIYGSAENTCNDIIGYDLADLEGLLANGITFVDSDSSGTLSEGDRFEFSDNYTGDNETFDNADMLRLYSISAEEYCDNNIKPTSSSSKMHEGAMNSIRNIRSIDSNGEQSVGLRMEKFVRA